MHYKITLDSLQIYFPWDEDLNRYLKERGFGQSNEDEEALPLIYTDNCEETRQLEKTKRRFVLEPRCFNRTFSELDWEKSEGCTDEIIIPAEKPELNIDIFDDEKASFEILPRTHDEEQYHLEYSSRESNGKMYTNWVAFYFGLEDFYAMLDELKRSIGSDISVTADNIRKEERQNKREDLFYARLDVDRYCFSISDFKYAVDYIENNGFKGDMPSLVYDSSDRSHDDKMDPFIKYGVIKTEKQDGFWEREAQIVIKIAQPKITQNKRGKDAKMKGAIEFPEKQRNEIVVELDEFYQKSMMLKKYLS